MEGEEECEREREGKGMGSRRVVGGGELEGEGEGGKHSALTWKRSSAIAVMLIVETNTLVPENIGTSLHIVSPNFHTGIDTW